MLTEQIANELVLASKILGTNNVSTIAQNIGYKPLLIMNALYYGEDAGKFTYNKKKDNIKVDPELAVDSLQLTDNINELIEQFEMLIGYLNKKEADLSVEEMQYVSGGVPELHIKMAVAHSKNLTSYEYADPKDKKSVYTFITLKGNKVNLWGTKQFKKATKEK